MKNWEKNGDLNQKGLKNEEKSQKGLKNDLKMLIQNIGGINEMQMFDCKSKKCFLQMDRYGQELTGSESSRGEEVELLVSCYDREIGKIIVRLNIDIDDNHLKTKLQLLQKI